MDGLSPQPVLTTALNLLIVAGWIVLIGIGLEPDKPRSGGIPGHVEPTRTVWRASGRLGRLGEVVGLILFGAVSFSLPVILAWVLRAHG